MRIHVLEDHDTFLTRMKYYFESAASAQNRFDRCKKHWCGEAMHSVHPHRRGGYYLIQVWTGMFPMPPPIWFAKKNLRRDQIEYLEEIIRTQEKQKGC